MLLNIGSNETGLWLLMSCLSFFYEILLNIIDKGFTKAESHIFIILIEISS